VIKRWRKVILAGNFIVSSLFIFAVSLLFRKKKYMDFFLIHGFSGWGDNLFFPSLRSVLESNGVNVVAPDMPETTKPTFPVWENYFLDVVIKNWKGGKIFFACHSMGGYFILRMVGKHRDSEWVKATEGIVLIGSSSKKRPEYMPMYDEDLPWEEIRKLPIKIHCFWSLDDPRILADHKDLIVNELGPMKTFVYHEVDGYKHFQIKEDVPIITECCLKLVEEAK
jgi:pimeloyl-ACP methyl ester carboxylesterase